MSASPEPKSPPKTAISITQGKKKTLSKSGSQPNLTNNPSISKNIKILLTDMRVTKIRIAKTVLKVEYCLESSRNCYVNKIGITLPLNQIDFSLI